MIAGPAPPGANLTGEKCEHVNAWGQCRNSASWALPEYPYCGHHTLDMPLPLIDAKRRRIERWHKEGAELWARIVAEEQPPDAE